MYDASLRTGLPRRFKKLETASFEEFSVIPSKFAAGGWVEVVGTVHILILSSREPEAMDNPSGENATEYTDLL